MEFLVLLAVLVCPIVMGGMMLLMMRQMRRGTTSGDQPHEDGPG